MLKWLVCPLLMSSLAVAADDDKENLDKISKSLKSTKLETVLSALDQAGNLGPSAQPIARDINRLMLSTNRKISEAAQGAYEKIEPKLHTLLVTISVEKDANKRIRAIRELAEFGPKAKSSLPVLSSRFTQESKDPDGDWDHLLEAMVKIDYEDPFVCSQVINLASIVAPPKMGTGRSYDYEKARRLGIRLLSKAAIMSDKQVKALMIALSNSTLTENRVRALQELEALGNAAKPALAMIRNLKTDGESRVREAAIKALAAIDK